MLTLALGKARGAERADSGDNNNSDNDDDYDDHDAQARVIMAESGSSKLCVPPQLVQGEIRREG